jgi:hypothetical protein
MGVLIEGAVQQAAQAGRQFMGRDAATYRACATLISARCAARWEALLDRMPGCTKK